VKVELKVKGMHCVGCENSVNEAVSGVNGVKKVKAECAREKVAVEFDESKTNAKIIAKVIDDAGFKVL
jgi:copper chaperone CopZ